MLHYLYPLYTIFCAVPYTHKRLKSSIAIDLIAGAFDVQYIEKCMIMVLTKQVMPTSLYITDSGVYDCVCV